LQEGIGDYNINKIEKEGFEKEKKLAEIEQELQSLAEKKTILETQLKDVNNYIKELASFYMKPSYNGLV
jgi:chaperonin cofactor prefoldin